MFTALLVVGLSVWIRDIAWALCFALQSDFHHGYWELNAMPVKAGLFLQPTPLEVPCEWLKFKMKKLQQLVALPV